MGFAGKDAAHVRHHEAVATATVLVPPHTICGFSEQNALRAELFRGSLDKLAASGLKTMVDFRPASEWSCPDWDQ